MHEVASPPHSRLRGRDAIVTEIAEDGDRHWGANSLSLAIKSSKTNTFPLHAHGFSTFCFDPSGKNDLAANKRF